MLIRIKIKKLLIVALMAATAVVAQSTQLVPVKPTNQSDLCKVLALAATIAKPQAQAKGNSSTSLKDFVYQHPIIAAVAVGYSGIAAYKLVIGAHRALKTPAAQVVTNLLFLAGGIVAAHICNSYTGTPQPLAITQPPAAQCQQSVAPVSQVVVTEIKDQGIQTSPEPLVTRLGTNNKLALQMVDNGRPVWVSNENGTLCIKAGANLSKAKLERTLSSATDGKKLVVQASPKRVDVYEITALSALETTTQLCEIIIAA